MSQSNRIEEINNLIIELASGNFDASGDISDQSDEFDAIITGINMLGEELKDSTVSRDYLKSIFQGVVDMLIVLDNDGNIIEVNDIICSLLQYSRKELLGNQLTHLLKNKRDQLKEINNLLMKNGYCHNIEKKFLTKTGKVIPVSCSVSLLYDNAKNKRGVLYIAKDISQIKKTEDDLRNKNLEMDTFIYKAAHDLKGPVASIIGISNFAPMDVKETTALKYFQMIKECCEKLDKVLVNLREIAAIEKAKKDRIRIDVKDKIEKVIVKFRDSIIFNNIKVILESKEDITLFVNDNILEMILENIIDNAIKFRKDSNPSISIRLKEVKDTVKITIKDNGIGIKKNLHHKVFNMFYRAHNSKDGSGLGLYMVKSFLSAIGGQVSLKSSENIGTTVTISLPLKS